MKNRPLPQLLLLCALLAAASLYAIFAPLPAYSVPQVPIQSIGELPPAPASFLTPPEAAFAAIGDRPLFDAKRRKYIPPAKSPADKAAPPPPPSLSLIGVIIDSDHRFAMVKTSDAMLAMSVAVGTEIAGWRVATVEPDRIVLQAGTAQDEIRLEANRAPPQNASQPSMASAAPQPHQTEQQAQTTTP